MAEERTFTQEEVNKLVGQARLEGKEIGRKEFDGWISPEAMTKQTEELSTQLTGLNDQIKALTDEKTNLQTQLTEKDGTIAKYETDSVKTKVAREYGLSYEAISFLQGETEDAIRESAKTLKGIVGSGSAPQFNPEGSKNVDSTEKAFIEMLGNLGGN